MIAFHMISTFNAYHLGDNLVHLHFMRKMARAYPEQKFGHYTHPMHRAQLAPVIADMPNLTLLEECPADAINAWRGHEQFWHRHPAKYNFVAFHIEWFFELSKRMGLETLLYSGPKDFEFDYPALKSEPDAKFDWLVVNSIPHSGQFRSYNPHDFDALIRTLMERGLNVITTAPTNTPAKCTNDGSKGLDVTDIGKLSQAARGIVGIATGPMWPTFNIWNRETPRIIMLDNEQVDIGLYTQHVKSIRDVYQYL